MKNILILSLFVVAALSCRKKKDTIVEITVKNEFSEVISGASVKLLTVPPYEQNAVPVLEMEGTTDANGVVRFNFNDVFQLGQAGVAVLNIEAEKSDLDGTGIIKVEEEQVSKKTVLID
jgi:hypothetical protein